MSRRPKTLYCYKEKNTQKWIMSDEDNDEEILLSIITNPNVDRSSVFCIFACSLMFGVSWLDRDIHADAKTSIYDFFNEYNLKQPTICKDKALNETIKQIAAEAKEEKEFKANSKYGFISPDGKYFHCDYQGHSSLAHDICFGQFETNNPEKYLEEHGWCKIYNAMDRKYAVYVGGKHVLTKEQMNKLTELGLDEAKDISKMMVKDWM